VDDRQLKELAWATAEVMNLAALIRRGDDAAWVGMGPEAPIRIVNELTTFAVLASAAGATDDVVDLAAAAVHARALSDEVQRSGLPVSRAAQAIALALLVALGVGPDILHALDGGDAVSVRD
jgi:hypothetical protein